ncbi:uncharacterized protein EAF01_003996 [Botrytis porri]|uniref:Uncharacterized protein n=1 Tax=Botrytis porri TaxID=87229 RepID=A0A4Z1KH12_9HELO|nr:uncharacterized protein EAF01_003996 [Botrytis porri]KAF7908241.1 hypothetical protein EAF01_003996 [Botrytis porri]TGO85371.1 hypothetical protein BPOR_0403g00070 [Botrytis porri]
MLEIFSEVMANKNTQVKKANLPPILPKPPSFFEGHDSLYWLEGTQSLQITIAYNEDNTQEETAAYMAILIDRVVEYGPWAAKIDLLIHPRIIRHWESSSIYIQHVSEMMALVDKINNTFITLSHINVRLEIDFSNFQQIKLAACFLAFKTHWFLSYYVEDRPVLFRIDTQGYLMRRLRGVYHRDCKL